MKNLIIVLLFSFIFCFQVFATPPEAVNLSYDKDAQIINIEIKHISNNVDKQYVRKIIIQKNSEKPIIQYFLRQPAPYKFSIAVPLEAKGGDQIKVDVFCSEGGFKKAIIIVEQDKEKMKAKLSADDISK